jgi:hypothetical protein
MKILIIQENGRHEDNRLFRECHNLSRSFERIGYECKIWGLGHPNFDERFEDFYENYDVIFILENYEENNWIPDLSNIKKLKVFWSIDSHCNPAGNVNTAIKHNVDIVLNSIESDQVLFSNKKTYYFPNAYPSDLIFPIENIEKKYFLGFCGTPFQYRMEIMNFLENRTNIDIKKDSWILGDGMVKSINSYKIHFNYSDNDDINYRVFETLGTKTCLLTSEVENLKTFFTDMVDVVMYKNREELIEKVEFLKSNEEFIYKIAESGYNKVIKHHTYDNRATEFIEIIKKHI